MAYEEWHKSNHSPKEHSEWVEGGRVVNPDDLEEPPVQMSEKELEKRTREKDELLAKLQGDVDRANAKEIINGREVAYLDETGSDGKSWRVYGIAPHFNGGTLTKFSDGKWTAKYSYTKVVTDKVHSRRIKEKIRQFYGPIYPEEIDSDKSHPVIFIKETNDVPFLTDLETLHYALCDDTVEIKGRKFPRKSISHSPALARRAISRQIAKAIKELNGETLRKMAGALDALAQIENRMLVGEKVIRSIQAVAKQLKRVPCKAEVRKHYEDKNSVLEDSRWSQIFKEIGFEWLPKGKSGPTPKSKGRSIRQKREFSSFS